MKDGGHGGDVTGRRLAHWSVDSGLMASKVATMTEEEVGVRQLKNGLSAYLRRVNEGRTIVVTDRGRAVARLVPPDLPEGLQRLIRQGRVRPARGGGRLPRPVLPYKPGSKLLSDIVIEDRK